MKRILYFLFITIGFFGYSQKAQKQNNNAPNPLFLSTGSLGSFEKVYNSLTAISKSINENTFMVNRLDEIRQGQIIITPENIKKSFNNVIIETRPSLNIEAQRVMYSGNFANPNMPIFTN